MRPVFALLLVVLLMAAVAAPVAAKPQHRGCGAAASGWEAVTYQRWLELTEQYDPANAPLSEVEKAVIVEGLVAMDKNEDGLVCWKLFVPSLKGAWPPGFFLIGDNVAAAGE